MEDVWAIQFYNSGVYNYLDGIQMPEHFHMMIFPRLEIYLISDILKAIKQPVAQKMVNMEKMQ
jgi:hypothetical protein